MFLMFSSFDLFEYFTLDLGDYHGRQAVCSLTAATCHPVGQC